MYNVMRPVNERSFVNHDHVHMFLYLENLDDILHNNRELKMLMETNSNITPENFPDCV